MAALSTGFALTPRQREANRLLTGPQRHTLLVGGSRSGKTFLLLRAIVIRALRCGGSRHLVVRLRYNAIKMAVIKDTLPKVMALCFPGITIKINLNDGFAVLPNGSEIWFIGVDQKERSDKILGSEYATVYFNESSELPYDSVLTVLSRLAQKTALRVRAYYDLNPGGTAHWTYRLFFEHKDPVSRLPLSDPENYASLYINPVHNIANIDPDYIQSMESWPAKKRKRFLDGQYVAEIDNALWTLDLIERQRILPDRMPPLRRILIAVDPSGCAGQEDYRSDEIGISVGGIGVDNCGYVIGDRTGRYSPETWARIAVESWREFCADKIIAEKNFGGDMVRAVLQGYDPRVPVEVVTATRGKFLRAEPIAGLYETGRIFHVGTFEKLEDQMTNFSTAGYLGDRSPDSVDAMVHCQTQLMLGQVTPPLIFGGLPI